MAQIALPGGEARDVAVFLKGLFAYVQPEGRSRLTDSLNDAPPFLRLLQGDVVALVNKRHVAYVEALSR